MRKKTLSLIPGLNVHMELFDRQVNRDFDNIHSVFPGCIAQKRPETEKNYYYVKKFLKNFNTFVIVPIQS